MILPPVLALVGDWRGAGRGLAAPPSPTLAKGRHLGQCGKKVEAL